MELKQIVEQLEWCKFKCEGGSLELNTAFIELKKISNIPIKPAVVEEKEYFVTFKKYLHPEWVEFKEIWGRKKLESTLSYNDNIKVIKTVRI